MNSINWRTFDDSDCDSFRIQKSFAGISIPFPNTLTPGDSIKFQVNASEPQEIVFVATDIDNMIALLNVRAKGIEVVKVGNGSALHLKAKGENPKFKLLKCSITQKTSQDPRNIVPKLEWHLVTEVTRNPAIVDYDYQDESGTTLDFYRIVTVKNGTLSLPSISQRSELTTDLLCFIEGRVVTAQNRPIVGMNIKARIAIPPACSTAATTLGPDYTTTKTDIYGRFVIALPRGRQYYLHIEALGYSWVVDIPDQPYASLLELIPTSKHYFSPFGDPQ